MMPGMCGLFPHIDVELVKLRAAAEVAGHLKLATWGTKEDLQQFAETGFDKFRVKLVDK